MNYPQRIVCLAAEAPEILAELGAFDRIVGVSGFARRPAQVRTLPKVGGFATPDMDRVLALDPELVIAISDIQADAVAALVRAGVPVVALAAHRLAHVWSNILMLGGLLGLQPEAQALVRRLQAALEALAHDQPDAPVRVYFEEWPDPPISGIGWVGDLIALAGGEDIFADRADRRLARDRIVTFDEIVARRPDLIIASWCGKRADLAAIRERPGWASLPALQRNAVYELPSDLILQTGPSLIEGAKRLAALVQQAGQARVQEKPA
ncbi:MAG TPA: helical backbone metal receptor [Caldilineaceae bacterium]|nr:helical backbone metal receptor [Caldilineaceae bacterium]